MEIINNVGLAPLTTFKIGGPAEYFCEVKDQFDALTAFEFAKSKKLNTFIIGGGSNILVSDEGYKGLVIKIINRGIEIIKENKQSIHLKVASGETWDEVVAFAVKNNWWGIENLSHIPGSTGAIAVQNVGAYGQEAKNVIESVMVFDTLTHQILNLPAEDCGFGYRQSIFNTSKKGRYIIFEIVFKLSKIPKPNLLYRDLQIRFKNEKPDLEKIRQTIIEIRDKKYPFPSAAKNGNAGSFFKNIILNEEKFVELKQNLEKNFSSENAVHLENKKFYENGKYKVPTAFLIDLCGLKTLEVGGAKINPHQPLIILNSNGNATANEVLSLAQAVKKIIFTKLGIILQIEPELVGFSQKQLHAIMDL